MELIGKIDIEFRKHKGKDELCYIPKINKVKVLGENGYILKESINYEKKVTDNKNMAIFFLNKKLNELKENMKFFL